jgi:hypothetical protein
VADHGCDPGRLALDIAGQVGPAGEVRCIDASDRVAGRAVRRLRGLVHVRVRAGDAAALPYADYSLDAAVCTQVYEYVPDVGRASRYCVARSRRPIPHPPLSPPATRDTVGFASRFRRSRRPVAASGMRLSSSRGSLDPRLRGSYGPTMSAGERLNVKHASWR